MSYALTSFRPCNVAFLCGFRALEMPVTAGITASRGAAPARNPSVSAGSADMDAHMSDVGDLAGVGKLASRGRR
jgi:hypothetical protein